MVALPIIKLLRFEELVINSKPPIFRILDLCRVSHNFMYASVTYFTCLPET